MVRVSTTLGSTTLLTLRRGATTSNRCHVAWMPPRSGQTRSFFGGRSSSQSQQQSSQSQQRPLRDAGLQWTSVLSNPSEDTPGPKGIPSRSQQVQQLQRPDTVYDLLVIGGGATGAGIALDAASRNLQVACVERGDFASETSSRSTKLIWAGLKYMGTATAALLTTKALSHPVQAVSDFYGEMKMVVHCHTERRYMTTVNPHLCTWMPILVPFYAWHVSPPPMGHWLYGYFPVLAPIVFKFYDALSGFTCPSSYWLTPSQAAEVFPQLASQNLKYAAVFYEGMHNDARTNLAIAMTAAEKGAHICNYMEAIDLLKDDSGRVVGARVRDRMTGKEFSVQAKKVVLAGGPFTDDLRQYESTDEETPKPAVRGAWGTHIILPGNVVPSNMGLLDYNTSDGRFLFILPWLGHTLVGTTDRKGPAETLHQPPETEVEWLLQESKTYLPHTSDRSAVTSAWRGWRPLAADPHADPNAPVSRDHVISEHPVSNVLFIAGGKWTTWREMAQEVVDRVVAAAAAKQDRSGAVVPPCQTLTLPLHGGGPDYSPDLANKLVEKHEYLPRDVAQHLADTYGTRAWEVLEPCAAKKKDDGLDRFVPDYPYVACEVRFACREYACTVEDVLSRRTRLAFINKEAALDAIDKVAEIMASELGWSRTVKRQQKEAAKHYIDTYGGRTPRQE